MNSTATAYGLDSDLEVVEHGAVSLAEALAQLDGRFARLQPTYESGDAAIRATMFGFSCASDDFVEFCIHAHDHVSCAVELPSLRPTGIQRLLGRAARIELELTSRDEAAALLTRFFETPESGFAAWLREQRA